MGGGYGHLNTSFLVPTSLGILTTYFAPNCGFSKPRNGYFIRFKVFSSPNGEEFDQKTKTPISIETLMALQ